MISPVAISLSQQLEEFASFITSEHRPGTPEGAFATHVYEAAGETGPVSAWGPMPSPEELRQGNAPKLAATGLALASKSAVCTPELHAAWQEGLVRLAGRNAFPLDRQTFAYRPVEAYSLAVGATKVLPPEHDLRIWLKGVFGKLEREVAQDAVAWELTRAGATLLDVAWSEKHQPDAEPDALATKLWLKWSGQTQKNAGDDVELSESLLRKSVLCRFSPPDVARASLLHLALRRSIHERLESDLKAAWLVRRDTADAASVIVNLCRRFPLFARQILTRHDKRKTIAIKDEYDVQDAMHALLRLHFDDVRAEEWAPSYAATSSRIDFLLKREKVVVEVKMTRKGLGQKEAANQLIQDKDRYRTHPDYRTLVCFVYDPDRYLSNPTALEDDVSEEGESFRVITVVSPTGI